MPLTIAKTPRARFERNGARWRQWWSRCRFYRVSECQRQGMPLRYYAERKEGEAWRIISTHLKKSPAIKACEHAKAAD